MRLVLCLLLATLMFAGIDATAQSVRPPENAVNADERGVGGDKLQDVLARQRGNGDEREQRLGLGDSAADNAAALGVQIGAGKTQRKVWEEVRFGATNSSSSVNGPAARVLVQNSGIDWLKFRRGPLREYGGWLLLGTIGLLALFFVIRGRIRIDHGWAGWSILRFTWVERFAHWLIAVSFLLLAATGLFLLFGRNGLMDWVGKETYATLAGFSKWTHDNVSWAFMFGVILVFVFWIAHNLPSRTDLTWIRYGGGFFGGKNPPARKFNFGQKLIFWSVVILGVSISASGLSLLFPYELPMFSKTFGILNDIGIPTLLGRDAFPTALVPHEEMQLAQTWHAIVGFLFIAIIIAHIYIGTIGMQGAFSAMGTGRVDANWAREHHSIWAEKKIAEGAGDQRVALRPSATPAE